jgi:hypothetical protein
MYDAGLLAILVLFDACSTSAGGKACRLSTVTSEYVDGMLVRCDILCAVFESKSKEQEVGACKVPDGVMDLICASHDANQGGFTTFRHV